MCYRNYFVAIFIYCFPLHLSETIFGCGGFVQSNFTINYARVDIMLYTKQGSLKYQTDCAPNNGYYLIPLYDKGDYILKIEPPPGWSFEPSSVSLHVDGVTDPCSLNQDINFVFKGFTIFGQVLSSGQQAGSVKNGPAQIKLELKDLSGNVVQETYSAEGGSYTFSPILSGSYLIEASHDKWQFVDHIENVKVDQDNVQTKNKIIVAGYDVKGHVFSEGEPIQGVHLLLFSKVKVEVSSGCNKEVVKSFTQPIELNYICHVTSMPDGSFFFPSLPSGKYKLIPFHKGEHIEFDVSPAEVDFEVKQGSYEFSKHFQVEGFGVVGRVLEAKDGGGLQNANIFVNGKHQAVTGKNGIYHLENMRAGVYDLKVEMPHIFFEVYSIKVTPNTPQLPDIFAAKFSICGHIRIENYPAGSTEPRLVALKSQKPEFQVNIPVQEDGTFCTVASPGTYVLEPLLSQAEKDYGLQFNPAQQTVQLRHYPILDVTFMQFLATLSGQIKCIGSCGALPVKILMPTNEDVLIETVTSNDGKFRVSGCLPGKYSLTVEENSWCFQTNKLDFTVTDKDVTDLVLRQSGFQAAIRLSHASEFKMKYPSGEVHVVSLEKAKNVLCLPEAGVYDLIPQGCHLYKSDIFKLDTNKPSEIDIQPTKHLVTGNVFTEVNVSDIKVSIHRHTSANLEIIPLKEPVEWKDKKYRYVFSVFVEPNTELEVRVSSSLLLFHPSTAHISVVDDCIDNAVEIIGKKGLFVNGSITPAIEQVKIQILDKQSNTKRSETFTDANGKFLVGPLDDSISYEVMAEKEGYFFTQHETVGHFVAYKLAEVIVEVKAEDGAPLTGVLLSLSGGTSYRKNSLTHKNGKVTFIGLNPGQYFLRPMLKEFQFQPPSKMIDIKEGTQVKIKISGKRVAYSLYGVVNSLTGEAEVGVAVEAVGIESEVCKQYQEEAISEQGGTFRIRGLQPGCQYNLHLKRGSDVNQHIERATPEETVVKVSDGDITDVRIIAFRHFSQMDITGSVITNQDYLPTLKVRLYCEDNLDQVLHTITLGRSGFFFLPSMPIDHRIYTLKLISSLSTSAYHYDTPSVTFHGNTSFYHFTFKFEPRQKSQDQEVTQGSILALPLAIIVILLVYYYDRCLNIVMQVWEAVSNILSPSRSPLASDNLATDSVNVRRKTKPRRAL